MTSVVHNQSLFNALLSCLKSTTDSPDISMAAASGGSQVHQPRKRNHSLDLSHTNTEAIANKSTKLAYGQSPHAGKRTLNSHSSTQSHHQSQQPEMNVRLVAATILFVAFDPLDHWPVPLVEAYAEDCFGGRTWVDDPACRPLVENLMLVHTGVNAEDPTLQTESGDDNGLESERAAAEAKMVAEFYRLEKQKHQMAHLEDDNGKRSPKSAEIGMF